MIGYSKKLFQDNNVVIITTDDYKPFHPKANEIARKFPTKYSSIVEQDSALWTNKVLHEAMKKKYNFIFEVTFRTERILSTIQELKEQGFNVIIRGLAVPELESLLSSYERYEKQVETRDWGRFFNPSNYNYIYKNVPDVIEKIEKGKYYDAIEIFKRGKDIKIPELIYANYTKKYREQYLNSHVVLNQFNYCTAKEAMLKSRNIEIKDMPKIKERVKILERAFYRRKLTEEELKAIRLLNDIVDNTV